MEKPVFFQMKLESKINKNELPDKSKMPEPIDVLVPISSIAYLIHSKGWTYDVIFKEGIASDYKVPQVNIYEEYVKII